MAAAHRAVRPPHLATPHRATPRPCTIARAFWKRGGAGESEGVPPPSGDAGKPSPSTPPTVPGQPPPPPLPFTPIVVRLPVLEGDTVKTLARRHGLTVSTVRAAAEAAGGKPARGSRGEPSLPQPGSTLAFLAPAALGPRARRAAGDLASSLVRGVPPPAQPIPWTSSMRGPLAATGRLGAGLALLWVGYHFWGAVGGALGRAWRRWGPPPAPWTEALVDDDEFSRDLADEEAAAAGLPVRDMAEVAAAVFDDARRQRGPLPAPPPHPPWATPGAPPVWRLGPRGDLGSQPVVPLARSPPRAPGLGAGLGAWVDALASRVRPRQPEQAWLCFESEADARAWGGWVAAGPARSRPDLKAGGRAPPVTSTSAADLSVAAMTAGRPLAFIPAGLAAALSGGGDDGEALDSGSEPAVLAWLSEHADSGRAGTACMSPPDRTRMEAAAAAGEVPSLAAVAAAARGAASPTTSASPSRRGRGGTKRRSPSSKAPTILTPPPPPIVDIDAGDTTAATAAIAWIPVMRLDGGESRGFLTLAPALPGGPPTAIGFESQEDAADLARAWNACGAGGQTPLEAVIGMEPAEFAAHLDAAGAVGAVLRPGLLDLPPAASVSVDALTDALLAAVSAGLAEGGDLGGLGADDEGGGFGGVWDV